MVTSLSNCYLGCHRGKTYCTLREKCDVGEGDCNFDSQCKSGLVCGTDNCVGSSLDCCTKPPGQIRLFGLIEI